MLQLLTIFGWIIALGCLIYLVAERVKTRPSERRRNKDAKGFLRQGTRNTGSVALTKPNKVSVYRPREFAVFGFVVLFLWEGYWGLEITEYYSRSNSLRLPYFFLFGMMVGVPLAIYLYSRRVLRRSTYSR
jgi:hypothetical protein